MPILTEASPASIRRIYVALPDGFDSGTAEHGNCLRNGDQGYEETQMSKLGDELVQSMAQALAVYDNRVIPGCPSNPASKLRI